MLKPQLQEKLDEIVDLVDDFESREDITGDDNIEFLEELKMYVEDRLDIIVKEGT